MDLLDDNDSSKDIDVASLSTGLKAFVILKQLLINGNVQDKDVIVLDEPEIHLHPEWQLLYAEIIVKGNLIFISLLQHIVLIFWKHWNYIPLNIIYQIDVIIICQH